MFVKFFYTLCALVGASGHTGTTTIINDMTSKDIVLINVEVGETVTRNLCLDFAPYITADTCGTTLFEPLKLEDFISICDENMELSPQISDLNCNLSKEYCTDRTYQLTINALNANDSSLIMDKEFDITVQATSISKIEILAFGLSILGTYTLCLIGCCCEKKHACIRKKVAQTIELTEMEPLQAPKSSLDLSLKCDTRQGNTILSILQE